MAEKKICSVCGRKINGVNSIANIVGNSTLCSSCYEKLGSFKISKRYKDKEELFQTKETVLSKANEYHYPTSVIKDLEVFLTVKKRCL